MGDHYIRGRAECPSAERQGAAATRWVGPSQAKPGRAGRPRGHQWHTLKLNDKSPSPQSGPPRLAERGAPFSAEPRRRRRPKLKLKPGWPSQAKALLSPIAFRFPTVSAQAAPFGLASSVPRSRGSQGTLPALLCVRREMEDVAYLPGRAWRSERSIYRGRRVQSV